MKFSDFTHPQTFAVERGSLDRDGVLRRVASLAVASPALSGMDEKSVYNLLRERESAHSTALGHGIAVPHCRIEKLDDFITGVLVVPDGVAFGSPDGKPSTIFPFIIAPATRRNEHIRLLSEVSVRLRSEDFRKTVLQVQNDSDLSDLFRPRQVEEEKPPSTGDYYLLTVVVQIEELFHDLLTLLTEVEDSYITVFEGNDAGKYLHALPLFSQFWSEEKRGYHRVITAVMRREHVNGMLERIEESTGNRDGVMIMVQDIPYMRGSLEI